jgi:hypothetical protein
VTFPARELFVLRLEDFVINVPAHHVRLGPEKAGNAAYVVAKSERPGIEARAAAIQIAPGSWDAYAWCTASSKEVRKTILHYRADGAWKKLEDAEYPFEFSIPVPGEKTTFKFRLEGETVRGEKFSTAESELRAGTADP